MLRFQLGMGISYRPGINWVMNSQFSQASNAEGLFQLYGNAPELVARLNLGLQLFHTNGIELRLGDDLSVGGNYLSQAPSAKITYRF
jgi:hypothetical protein